MMQVYLVLDAGHAPEHGLPCVPIQQDQQKVVPEAAGRSIA